jgi:hypothetical protein
VARSVTVQVKWRSDQGWYFWGSSPSGTVRVHEVSRADIVTVQPSTPPFEVATITGWIDSRPSIAGNPM